MLVPAITKKMVSFDDEEDELHALDSELASRDDLDEITHTSYPDRATMIQNNTTNIEQATANPRRGESQSSKNLTTFNSVKENGLNVPIIATITSHCSDAEKLIPNTNSPNINNVKILANGNQKNSIGSGSIHKYPRNNQREQEVISSSSHKSKMKQSISENGISQSLIERRLLSLQNTKIINNGSSCSSLDSAGATTKAVAHLTLPNSEACKIANGSAKTAAQKDNISSTGISLSDASIER